MNGQLAVEEKEQNTLKVVQWNNYQAFVDKLASLCNVICSFRIVSSTGDLVLNVLPWMYLKYQNVCGSRPKYPSFLMCRLIKL